MTSEKRLKILLVEDSDSDAQLLREMLMISGRNDLYISAAKSLRETIDHLKNNYVDAMLLDLTLPDSAGLETIQRLRQANPDIPIVVLTGVDDENTGVEAVRTGVQDYLVKGRADGTLIIRDIRYAIERKVAEQELRRARDELEMRVRERTFDLSKANTELAAEIAERSRSETRTRIMNVLLELFAQKTSRKEYLDAVVNAIHEWTGCECIGIRLTNEDGLIPYESHVGFSDEFLAMENTLCLKTDACICIRAISQTPEPHDGPLLTQKGSFRSNNSFEFVKALPTEAVKRYRGNCMKFGFASLAVMPIRYRGRVLGAVHLADRQKNKMPTEMVEFLESMAMLIGEAVHRFDIESNLRESEEQYRRLVELSPDGIGVERNDRIVFVNTAGANLLGYKNPEELLGKTIFDFVHPDYRRRTLRQLEYLRRKQKAIPLRENKFLRTDGTVLDIEVAATPLIYENKPAAQIVFRDITDRKLAQERILADQRMLRSLTAELVLPEERERHEVATALHDSIGPLLAFAKRELGTLQKSVPPKIAEPLKNISFNIGQAITQTRTLTFDLSPPTLYTLGFETAVEELVEKFCKEQNLQFTYSNSDEQKPLTDHIKILLYRSIRELLINTAKHAEAKAVRVSLSKVNDEININVEDDGKGFNTALFNGRSPKRSGLGLFSVQERLTHIGGKLDIESSRKGTKITLTAPLKLT
jgi:PAS domain S-box-containing protein